MSSQDTEGTLKDARELLLERRRVLSGDVRGLEAGARGEGTEASASVSSNPMERAADDAERDLSLGRMESQNSEIREIDEALERVRDGSFGVCEECGRAVPAERLEAIPYARRCAACQLKEEEESR